MEYTKFTAKTVDEAITQACLDLGVTSDRLEYSVVQQASSGFLGIGSKPAVISARIREEKPEVKPVVKQAAKPVEKKAETKNEKKVEEPVKAAEGAVKQEEKKAEAPKVQQERRVITMDEIEKRAKEAEERAKAQGIDPGERPERREREEGRSRRDRNDRRGDKKKGGRRDDRRPRREREEAPVLVHHEPSKPKPERVVKERTEEEANELVSCAETFLKDVFKAMNIEAEMTLSYDAEEGSVNCTFAGEEMGLLIGKRGQTLDSIQYLTSLVINKKTEDYVRVKLDTEDYRSRRADTLNNLARNIAYKVRKTRRPVALEPMNPYERRIIHSALQSSKFVETYSEGEEPYRHVVVAPKR